MNIIVIGGGASGMMVGGFLTQNGHNVTLIEKNEKLGKKLFITGKGRCNITNNSTKEEYLNNVVHGGKFMMSAINNFDAQSTIDFFENLGLSVKTERGGRVFPESDKSSDVIKALSLHAKDCEIRLNECVEYVHVDGEGFIVKTDKQTLVADRVIIATGGKSYPATGSTGDGYKFAKILGHEVSPILPALVPIRIKDKFCADLEGLSLKNVTLKCKINGKKKDLFGEMLFTHDAISGPIALSLSSFIGASIATLAIDFKPALTEEMLEKRLLKDIEENKNKNIAYILKGLLPHRLVDIFIEKLGVERDLKVNAITVNLRKNLVALLKHFPLQFGGLYPIEAGIITSGGVNLKEINPKTMESKLIKGLYFIGEVLDCDCLTGGYNLQTAFSTAYVCAKYME